MSLGLGISRLGLTPPGSGATVVGGAAIGSIGTTGIYNGLQLMDGDDFTAPLSSLVVTPGKPHNPWFCNTPYNNPRGQSASLPAAVVDIGYTGYHDANRGVALTQDAQTKPSSSVLRQKARVTTAGEKCCSTMPTTSPPTCIRRGG